MALALTPKTGEADALASSAISTSADIQAQTLAHAARAILTLRTESRDAEEAVSDLARVLATRMNWDSLVTAYRAYPPLLPALADQGEIGTGRLHAVVSQARDGGVAASAGFHDNGSRPFTSALTRREQEIFDLVAQGMRNAEIASLLFISPATVKVHMRHILEKLDARSRTEAVSKYHDA
jgi:DNA-binding NarL/FixJ family response regulator